MLNQFEYFAPVLSCFNEVILKLLTRKDEMILLQSSGGFSPRCKTAWVIRYYFELYKKKTKLDLGFIAIGFSVILIIASRVSVPLTQISVVLKPVIFL